jgi:hypothetical protein
LKPPSQTSPAPYASADGPIRLRTFTGCPETWQEKELSKLSMGTAIKAMETYGRKSLDGPIDATIEARTTDGFVCARPRGEPRCYWTEERWIETFRE